MADLTLVTAYESFNLPWKRAGVLVVKFTGTNHNDATEIGAAVTGKRYIILGGRISFNGAARLDIISGTTVVDSIEAAVRCTANFSKGLELIVSEKFELQKTEAGVTVRGWVAFKAIADGEDMDPMLNA